MKYLIIGLGIYGANLARNLTALGHEVIGVDRNENAVEHVKDYVSTVYNVDTTDEIQMGALPLKSVDLVIVAIGENFGASVRTVAILKHMEVPHIYARAIDPLHKSILECFELDRILTPEQRAASDLTMEMLLGSHVETLSIDADTVIVKFTAPDYFVGDAYTQLQLLDKLSIRLLAATRPTEHVNLLGVKVKQAKMLDITDGATRVEAGDIFTCQAARKAYRDLMRQAATDTLV